MLDEHDLPPLDEIIQTIRLARAWNRAVAVHCVTAGELVMTLAAFESAGARVGDRIEHGGVIPFAALSDIARLGLTVVTQPGFLHARGERYLVEVAPWEHDDLYRCASLLACGAPVAASSDAPYGPLDPWLAMRTAVRRETSGGRSLGSAERVSPQTALQLFLGGFQQPGGPQRRVAPGETADLCLLRTPLHEALYTLSSDLVAATLVGGRIIYRGV